jgi:ABC-type branched-subunit amino acid transport system substrate-binding protein
MISGPAGRVLPFAAFVLALSFLAVLSGCSDEENGAVSGTAAPTGTSAPAPTSSAEPAATTSPRTETPGITDTQIVLGVDAPLAGMSGAVYSMIPRATEAYFKYVNETQGGVCGREIVYKFEDNEGSPEGGLEAVRKLVERDKVFAVVGSLGDDPHTTAWDYLNENNVPDILVSAGAHRFGSDSEGHPWTVQMIPSYTIEGTFYGQYISENLPGKTVGVLGASGPLYFDALEGLKSGLDSTKNEIVSEQVFELTALSIRSEVTNLRQADPDVVVSFADPGFTAQAVKEANRLGWHPQWVISYTSSDDIMFQFVSPELLEGAVTFQAFNLASMKDNPAIASHWELMKDYGGPQPTNFSVYAQLLGELAVEVLSRTCDNLTREGLMDAVESVQVWHSDLLLDGVNVSFSETDHTALQTGRMLRAGVEGNKGKWEYFGPLYEFEGMAESGE